MTKALDQTQGLSASDAKVLADIKRVGWHTIGVFLTAGEGGSNWAYSIGLYKSFNHPEVILIGLPLETSMEIINVIGNAIKTGMGFKAGQSYPDILQDPFRCAFKDAQRSHYVDYVGYALWFYEQDEFPLVQCFWPDKESRLPWDVNCNEYVKSSQRTCLSDKL